MRVWRDIGAEAIKALAVLALIFLSFAHEPVQLPDPAADGPAWSVADLSYCGSGPDGDGGHAPCHACRAGVADLPPAPCLAAPAYAGFVLAAFGTSDDLVVAQGVSGLRHSRAPPASV